MVALLRIRPGRIGGVGGGVRGRVRRHHRRTRHLGGVTLGLFRRLGDRGIDFSSTRQVVDLLSTSMGARHSSQVVWSVLRKLWVLLSSELVDYSERSLCRRTDARTTYTKSFGSEPYKHSPHYGTVYGLLFTWTDTELYQVLFPSLVVSASLLPGCATKKDRPRKNRPRKRRRGTRQAYKEKALNRSEGKDSKTWARRIGPRRQLIPTRQPM